MKVTLLAMDSPVATPSRSGDSALRQRLIDGDGAALATAYDTHGHAVLAIARRVTANRTAAEDVAQEVFVTLWQRPESFDPLRGSLRTFLSVVAHRRAVDHVRSQVARQAREANVGRPLRYEIGEIPVEDRVLAALDGQAARSSLASLPREQRECLELAYFGGLTFREVATRLRIPEGTAKGRIRLGIKRLQAMLEVDRESKHE